MQEKPSYERFVSGITLQVYNKVFTIDWGSQVGYKVSNRLLIGAGGVYRIGVSEKYSKWINRAGIYGYRAYVDFSLVKSGMGLIVIYFMFFTLIIHHYKGKG